MPIKSTYHRTRLLSLLCLLLLVPVFGYVVAQESSEASDPATQNFSREKWRTITSDIDYSGKPQENKEEEKEDQFGDFEISETPEYQGDLSFGGPLFQAFAILFLIALVAIVVLYLLNGGFLSPPNKQIKNSEITLENIEENILETELDKFIREAIERGEYGLAIRLYYLSVIKELSLKSLIKWKRDKTNGAYLREMRSSAYFSDFRGLTNTFESIRYGGGQVSRHEFSVLEPRFKNFVSQLRHLQQ